jgi:hypothetical protein
MQFTAIALEKMDSWPSVFMRFTPFNFSILESSLEFAIERD